jgi:hypothetical protein
LTTSSENKNSPIKSKKKKKKKKKKSIMAHHLTYSFQENKQKMFLSLAKQIPNS